MTGRVYLDWNASAPLRKEARAAAVAALDIGGNPSSVHAEGRAARGALERARAQVAALVGCDAEQVAFTSGASEAAALAAAQLGSLAGGAVEHDCVFAHVARTLSVDGAGRVTLEGEGPFALQAANSETGVLQPEARADLVDAVQALGKTGWRYDPARMRFAMLSAHKIGGPRGAGALIVPEGAEIAPLIAGGGQERRRRAGTENLAAIAGFGAAAEAIAGEDWGECAEWRDRLQARLADAAPDAIFPSGDAPRLPNTLCVSVPGWAAQMQVMRLDLAGFAVSAGAACSSGKIAPSRALLAMGFDERTASCAIRISFGPQTGWAALERFAGCWIADYNSRRQAA